MTQSMTAFARVEQSTQLGTLSWEVRSVNHRYLEPGIRLPDILRELEPVVRDLLRQQISRGKIECTLKYEPASHQQGLELNLSYAKQLIQSAEQLAALMQKAAPLDPLELLRWPEVIASQNQDNKELLTQASALFKQALQQLKSHRAREGAELARLIEQRLAQIHEEVETLGAAVPQMLEAQRQKILARCAELAMEPDPQRLEQELVMLAQRSDVAEELDRIKTHLQEVRHTLGSKGAIGRRLDFLMQELNREANTLGSKAIDVRTTQASVNIKVLIEQMREQIQNLE